MKNRPTPLILAALLFLLFTACSKDNSTDDVSIYSFEYSASTMDYENKNLGIRAKTGDVVEFDSKYYNYVNEDDQDSRCDIYIEPTNSGINILTDDFSYLKAERDIRPRFVYSSFTGDIDKINHPSELPQNLPENLEWSFEDSDKSICYVFYPVIEYTVPGNLADEEFSFYKGKYKLGEPQFLFQITEQNQYDYQYSATTKLKRTDYKVRTKYFDYK